MLTTNYCIKINSVMYVVILYGPVYLYSKKRGKLTLLYNCITIYAPILNTIRHTH